MKRRHFLKTAPVLTLPLLIKNFPVEAMTESPLLHLVGKQSLLNGRVLVLIQLSGGNDGLNTVIPLDRYAELTNARANILLPPSNVLSLNNSTATGLHPAMTDLQTMYNLGMLNIVQGVSYANPSFSHFRATDIWLTGAQSGEYLSTGWLGRSIDQQYPGFPNGNVSTDPLAVQIGTQASPVVQTSQTNAAFTLTSVSNFYDFTSGTPPVLPDTPFNNELTFIRKLQYQTDKYSTVITSANAKGKNFNNGNDYPSTNSLAQQLKIVAKLISGGLKTPIYIVNHPNSFDTHATQVVATDHTTGVHANALGLLSKAIGVFQNDLKQQGLQDRVTGMTFTEFGRRIKSNDNAGTDHGTSIPMFFFGAKVNPALTGLSPVLPANAAVGDQIPMQFDFRQVYSTVLRDWFQLSNTDLQSIFVNTAFTSLPIFSQIAVPVSIISFTGNWKKAEVALQWTVDQELNISSYELERSEDGISFSKRGTTNALNVSSKHDYIWYDTSLQRPFYYYRIRIVEKTGGTKFSEVLLLRNTEAVDGVRVKIMPNPIDNWFITSFQDKISGPVTVRMLNLEGKELWKSEQQANDTFNLTFTINKRITPGVYLVQVRSKDYEASSRVLVR